MTISDWKSEASNQRVESEYRAADQFNWEWRTEGQNQGRWQNVLGGSNSINFAVRRRGENIVEVRPKDGTHVWSNRNPSNPQADPGPQGDEPRQYGGRADVEGGAATGQDARLPDFHRKVPDIPNQSITSGSIRHRSRREDTVGPVDSHGAATTPAMR